MSHFTAIDRSLPKNIVVVNLRAFHALPAGVQTAVLEAAAAEQRRIEMSKAETAEKVAVMQEKGMTIAQPTSELITGLEAIGETILTNWKTNASAPAFAILTQYHAH